MIFAIGFFFFFFTRSMILLILLTLSILPIPVVDPASLHLLLYKHIEDKPANELLVYCTGYRSSAGTSTQATRWKKTTHKMHDSVKQAVSPRVGKVGRSIER